MLQKSEEIMWRQKPRITRMTCRDINTLFFYLSTVNHRRRNTVGLLKGRNDQWTDLHCGLHGTSRHKNTSPISVSPQIHRKTRIRPPFSYQSSRRRTINHTHCSIPDRLVVQQAIFLLGPRKCPGSDGMRASFYQKY